MSIAESPTRHREYSRLASPLLNLAPRDWQSPQALRQLPMLFRISHRLDTTWSLLSLSMAEHTISLLTLFLAMASRLSSCIHAILRNMRRQLMRIHVLFTLRRSLILILILRILIRWQKLLIDTIFLSSLTIRSLPLISSAQSNMEPMSSLNRQPSSSEDTATASEA